MGGEWGGGGWEPGSKGGGTWDSEDDGGLKRGTFKKIVQYFAKWKKQQKVGNTLKVGETRNEIAKFSFSLPPPTPTPLVSSPLLYLQYNWIWGGWRRWIGSSLTMRMICTRERICDCLSRTSCITACMKPVSRFDCLGYHREMRSLRSLCTNFLNIYMYFSFCQQAIEAPCLIPSVIFCKRRSCEDFLCQIFDHWFRNVFVTCSSCLTCEQVLIYMQTTGD